MIRLPKYPKFGAGDQTVRIAGIAARLGIDLAAFGPRSAVITGSNGKGSTAAMLASILSATGARTGRFTSPHLFEINERFWCDGADIPDAALGAAWDEAEKAADAWLAAHPEHMLGGFEFLFLVAARWFQQQRCEWIVWEAGIGGRRDVTRLVLPRWAAITSLDLEHTHLLGETLEEIARDKADVAPPGGALFLGQSVQSYAESIRRHAGARGVGICNAPAINLAAPLAGTHQAQNGALAAALAQEMCAATPAQIAAGLGATRWPGRLERISMAPDIVIDVGHSPGAIAAAFAAYDAMRPNGALLVCGASDDKDAAGIITPLARAFGVVLTTRAHHKGRAAAEIAAIARAANPGAEIIIAETVETAYATVMARRAPAYVAGGLFVAAEFKAVHEGRNAAALRFF